jgi:hypothetical protein
MMCGVTVLSCLQGSLLVALTTLVTNSCAQPNYILCFPVTVTYNPAPNPRPSGSSSPTNDSPTGDNNAAGNLAFTLHQQHIRAGMDSSVYLTLSFMNISGTEILLMNTVMGEGGTRHLSPYPLVFRGRNQNRRKERSIPNINNKNNKNNYSFLNT